MAKISIPNLVSGVSTYYWIGDDLNKGTLVSTTTGSHGATHASGYILQGCAHARADCPNPPSVGTLTLYDSLFPWITRLIAQPPLEADAATLQRTHNILVFVREYEGTRDVLVLFTFEIASMSKRTQMPTE